MRTLQEKYNGIQEGKFSKEHFLAEARMQQPQLITRFNGYDDAVQILKNRGMIKEAATFKFSDLKQGNILQNKFSGEKYTVTAVRDKSADIQQGDDGKETEIASLNNYELIKEARLTKNSLTDYRYKPTNEMDKYPYEQILRGLRVELEGLGVHATPTAEEYAKALAKVSKNLAKDSIFYTNQVAGVNPKVDLHDKMVPFTEKTKVDTFNGMKKAELKEGFKKLIKKVLSENMGDMFGDKERAERAANYGQPGENEYEFYSDPENYNEEEEFDLHGEEEADDIPHPRGYEEASDEEDLDESKMSDVYQIAQQYDRFEDFVQAVEEEFGPVEDIAELEYIFNATRSEDDIEYGDENFSDSFIDGEGDLYEVRKAKSLSELLK
jgi:hypothetical protein